jgi:hypothetical protein
MRLFGKMFDGIRKNLKSMLTFRLTHRIHEEKPLILKMALAIKNTPALEGKASKRFNELIKPKATSGVSEQQIRKIWALTESILSKKK